MTVLRPVQVLPPEHPVRPDRVLLQVVSAIDPNAVQRVVIGRRFRFRFRRWRLGLRFHFLEHYVQVPMVCTPHHPQSANDIAIIAHPDVRCTARRRDFDPAGITDGDGRTYWTTDDGVITASLEIELGRPTTFDRAMVQEMITTGQRVEQFKLEAFVDNKWQEIAQGTTIGYKRLLRFPATTTSRVRLTILDSRDCPTIREFGLFKASPKEGDGP